jgi:hypothetical protein
VLLLLLGGVIAVPPIVTELAPDRPPARDRGDAAAPTPPDGGYRVFVADWGYHTSVIIEQPPGARRGPVGRERARFVEYAWGDRRFYMESDYRPHSVFAALFLPTESVVYLAAWDTAPDSAPARPRALYARTVTGPQLSALVTAVERQIRPASTGGDHRDRARAPAFAPARGYTGRFYPAYGRYLWSNSCNRWTADRLAEAGLARGGRGVIFSGQVAARLAGFGVVARGPASY